MSYTPIIACIDSLPPLPESVILIEKFFAESNSDINKLISLIEADPLLTTDILSKANAPYYGFSKTIVSVLQAVTLFGAVQIRSLVLSITLQRSFDINLVPYGISTSMFSQISTLQSELIFQWYMGIDINIAREITPIAFLMEVGKILIAKDVIEEKHTEEFLNDLNTYTDINYVENIYTMMTTAQINALIFQHLNLNNSFYETMQYLDEEKEVPEIIKDMVFALRVVRRAVNVQEQLSDNSINQALALLQEEEQDTKTFLRTVKRLQNKFLQ